jgi:hypothetical protein
MDSQRTSLRPRTRNRCRRRQVHVGGRGRIRGRIELTEAGDAATAKVSEKGRRNGKGQRRDTAGTGKSTISLLH